MSRATTCGHNPHRAKGLCQKCYSASYHAENRERDNERNATWRMANFEQVRETSKTRNAADPERNRERARAWKAANPERALERARAWRRANPERSRANNQRWQDENPELWLEIRTTSDWRSRARRYGVVDDLTWQEWQAILEESGYRCMYCDHGDVKLEMEHVVPLSRGGGHTARNVVPACRSCNAGKSDRTAAEWIPDWKPPRWTSGEILA